MSLLLYEAFRHAGKTVAINDWDAQGTSTKALELIDPRNPDSKPPRPDIFIWDTPPSLDHTATATAVRHADIALVISSPYPADRWETEEAFQFARDLNPNALVRVVINKFRKTTLLGRLVAGAANDHDGDDPTLPVMLSFRECYAHAVGQGWKALDSAAREEVLQFAVALLSLK